MDPILLAALLFSYLTIAIFVVMGFADRKEEPKTPAILAVLAAFSWPLTLSALVAYRIARGE